MTKPTRKPSPKSLRAYCGEYLWSPFGLHLGLNACSHNCWYCFANLNMPDRRFSLASVRNALADQASTFEAWLIANRFGALISNDSDPLAASNVDQFQVVTELLNERGIHWSVQTKGGSEAAQRIILDGPPRVVYVSLTSDDDDHLARAEPGAPRFAARLALLRDAVDAGHFVIAGINPLVPGWWDDPLAIADHLHRAGVTRAWVGALHLNPEQAQRLRARDRRDWPLEIKVAMGRTDFAGFDAAIDAMEGGGIRVYDGVSRGHDFWTGIDALGFRVMPLADRFFGAVRDAAQGEPIMVTFEAFDRFTRTADFPPRSILKEYAKQFRRDIYERTGQELSVRSMREVNALMWDCINFPRSPLYCHQWSLAVNGDDSVPVDEEGRFIFVYDETRTYHDARGSVLWDLQQRPVANVVEA